MATRVCPNCGSQYVASVRRCIDCDVMLVEEVGKDGEAPDASIATPVGDGDEIAYELEGWGNQLKQTLEGMLDNAGIRRVWEAGALLVPAADEERVDELIAIVEGGDVIELDDDVSQVAFEIEGVTQEELEELDARLIAEQIAHAWGDDGSLLVAEADEPTVATLIEEVLDPAEDEDPDDGMELHEVLDALYVAVDKLHKDPLDVKLVRRFVDAAEALEDQGTPYGLSTDDWQRFLDQVGETVAFLDPSASDEDNEVDDDADAGDEVDAGDEDEDEDEDEADAGDGDEGDDSGIPSVIEVDDFEVGPNDVARVLGEADEDDGDGADEDDGDGADEDDGDGADEDDGDGEDPGEERLAEARELTSALRDRLRDFV